MLTSAVAFEEIKARVARGAPVSDGAQCVDVDESVRPHAFRWSTFEEWREQSWSVRVQAKAEDEKLQSDEERQRLRKRKKGLTQGILLPTSLFSHAEEDEGEEENDELEDATNVE